ncbi:hypothetical protein CYMTET_36157 [Cymbomonas tetramitiformis]|uniref:Nodulin-like domain-containing protein n=1 Tax=Cymbomonas tetramitiformis TaxID=36881 RepID=A0AAE0F7G5_9CHLO|nr:hypothetical protein CYMTET_36157 [Cymbomonas tetramitiformis]
MSIVESTFVFSRLEDRVPVPKGFNKFHSLAAGYLLCCSLCTFSIFGLYTQDLRENYGYSQSEITHLSNARHSSALLALVIAILHDRIGVFWCNACCALANLWGFAMILGWLSGLWEPSLWFNMLIHAIAYSGATAMTFPVTARLLVCFPKHIGQVIGGVWALVFTSSTLLVKIENLYGLQTALAVTMLLPSVTALFLFPFLREVPDANPTRDEDLATDWVPPLPCTEQAPSPLH